MSSKSKFSTFCDSKRSASISTTKSMLLSATSSLKSSNNKSSPTNSPQISKSNVLSSIPFRYALASDGCTTHPKRLHSTSSPVNSMSTLLVDSQPYSSSSLSGRYYINGSLEPNGRSDEYLFKKHESISSSDIDDARSCLNRSTISPKSFDKNHIFFVQGDEDKTETEAAEENDTFVEHSNYDNKLNGNDPNEKIKTLLDPFEHDSTLSNLLSTSTLPLKLPEELSALKRYGIRRHHSAPQSDAKWLQVRLRFLCLSPS